MAHKFWLPVLRVLVALAAAPVEAVETQTAMPARVIAVGDLHGDYDAWRDIARDAGLVDAKSRWSGGATVLVQTGDVADRGADSRRIIRDLMRLQREAARAGGRVVALVGNHEAMNMTGDTRYVSKGEYAAFADVNSVRWRDFAFEANRKAIINGFRETSPMKSDKDIRTAWIAETPLGKIEHQAAWSASGEIGKWVIGNPAVLRLGDTIFVHGGLNAAFAKRPVEVINAEVAAALRTRDTSERAIINDQDGPLWYRGLAEAASDEPGETQGSDAAGATLDAVLNSLGAAHMVIGHTPSLTGIALRHRGKLAMIDTGISRAYAGVVSYLEISGDVFVPHVVARSPPGKWGKP